MPRYPGNLNNAKDGLDFNVAAITRLHKLGMLSTRKVKMREVLTEILDAAIDVTGADFGNIQLIHPATGRLKIVAQRGFSDSWVEFWDKVSEGSGACGKALGLKSRVIVEDVEQSKIFKGTPGLLVLLESGVRAVQSTPLVSRSGQMLGMFSTHYNKPHRPDNLTLEWVDLLARQAADLIEQRQAQTALKKRSRELARLAGELTLAEHRERRRIASHLHDNLQQWLVGARLQVQALSLCATEENAEAFERLGETLKEAIEDTRRLSRELAPTVSIHGNLPENFHWLASEARRQHLLEVAVDIQGGFADVPEPDCILLYSAARELLLNIVKHSGVHAATLSLVREDRGVILTIRDNGRGYDPLAVATNNTQGLGLFSIRERLALLGGNLAVESGSECGTSVVLELPIRVLSSAAKGGEMNQAEGQGKVLDSPSVAPSSAEGRIRVVFVDDHPIVRESLVLYVASDPDIEVVGQCQNGLEALEFAERLRPDVFVMDGNMPVMDGIEATRAIKARWPEIKIIGLSMMEASVGGEKMRAAGADAFVSKSGPAEELVEAIRRCYGGGPTSNTAPK